MAIKEIRKEYKKHIAHLENQNYEFVDHEEELAWISELVEEIQRVFEQNQQDARDPPN